MILDRFGKAFNPRVQLVRGPSGGLLRGPDGGLAGSLDCCCETDITNCDYYNGSNDPHSAGITFVLNGSEKPINTTGVRADTECCENNLDGSYFLPIRDDAGDDLTGEFSTFPGGFITNCYATECHFDEAFWETDALAMATCGGLAERTADSGNEWVWGAKVRAFGSDPSLPGSFCPVFFAEWYFGYQEPIGPHIYSGMFILPCLGHQSSGSGWAAWCDLSGATVTLFT